VGASKGKRNSAVCGSACASLKRHCNAKVIGSGRALRRLSQA